MMRIFCIVALLALPMAVGAQPYFVYGDFDSTSGIPASASVQLLDDGNPPDASAADGVYSGTISDSASPPARRDYAVTTDLATKLAPPGGGSGRQFSYLVGATPVSIDIFFDTNTPADGFTPATNRSWATGGNTPTSWTATGDFQVAAGGSSDWTPSDATMHLADDGVSPDAVAADGIWAITLANLPSGGWQLKIVANDDWPNAAFGVEGYGDNTANIAFSTTTSPESVNVFANANNGSFNVGGAAGAVPVELSVFSTD